MKESIVQTLTEKKNTPISIEDSNLMVLDKKFNAVCNPKLIYTYMYKNV